MLTFSAFASSSQGNLYSVDDGESRVLIECGLSIKEIRKALGYSLSAVAFALLTHQDQDHSRSAVALMQSGIDLFTSRGTADALGLQGHRLRIIQAKKEFSIGSWTVLPFDTIHQAPEPLGFLIANSLGEKLAFATDTPYLKYRFVGLNIIAIECNYSERILKANKSISSYLRQQIVRNHFSLENVKEFLKANDLSKVREIFLLHLSDANSDAARFKREIQELTGKPTYIAHKGGKPALSQESEEVLNAVGIGLRVRLARAGKGK